MKKTMFLLSFILLLSSCGESPESQDNSNYYASPIPSFIDNNANYSLIEPQNTNDNTGMSNNKNSSVANNNANQNPLVVSVDPATFFPHEIAFDCNTLSFYETMDFYSSFVEQFERLNRFSLTDTKYMAMKISETEKNATIQRGLSVKETREHIVSSCMAKDNSVFIVLSEGEEEGYGFKIVRYLVQGRILEVAQREDEQTGTHWAYVPNLFGKRSGTVLYLAVIEKNEKGSQKVNFLYDYVNNVIKKETK